MVACYPGAERGMYYRHVDDDQLHFHRRLTILLYLNQDWTEKDGGQLRLYHEGEDNTAVRFDVLPVANRLLLFWSSKECPHEVLSTCRDRYAITVWFVDGNSAMKSTGEVRSRNLMRMLRELHPVAPLSRREALGRAASDPKEARRLERLDDAVPEQRAFPQLDTANIGALERLFSRMADVEDGAVIQKGKGHCTQCGAACEEGEEGSDEFAGGWFCEDCWKLFRPAPIGQQAREQLLREALAAASSGTATPEQMQRLAQ